ncbi:MAG: chromosomal replication initiator protein DnaA [Kiritimatiellae bacterium]|nr:chromosomal replication initiator protein DnaA [Kiritimatiellia bacterium]MDD5519219.1 chromosomal replication initiator protein DnaA [Kiritimatiellia bacterium]
MSKEDAIALWSKACKHLEEVLPGDVFSRWIAVIEAAELSEDILTLVVDNDFYQSWLEENYLSHINKAVAAVSGTQYNIKFAIREESIISSTPSEIPEDLGTKKKAIRDRLPKRNQPQSTLNPKYVFAEFIVGSSNSFAHAASLAVAQAPARAYNPLFIYGGTGLGKTHIMQAIGHHVLATSRATVCYLSSEEFTNEYIEALQNRSLVQFRKKYRNTDLLLIDDIHFLAGKERLQEEFFHTFNALFDAHKQIVMTSDRPANEITRLEQRLVSRFEWGLVTELVPPDLETRIAILRHKQAQTNITLPDELITYIAQNIRSNIRRLEGALIRAVSYSSLTGHKLTLEALQYLLRDTIDQEKQAEVTFDKIQKAVAEHYDIRLADMTSKHRPQAIVGPRQVAMYLCRRMTRASLPDIANAFSKTHATILHAYKSIDSRMDVDNDLKQDILKISQKLGRSLDINSCEKKTVDLCE